MTIFVVSTLLTAGTLKAEDCSEVRKDCHAVLDKADALINDLKAQVRTQQQALESCYRGQTELRIQVEELAEANTSIWKNPYAMAGLGIIVGVGGYLYLTK